jgi:cysteine desulfuration protein SufE
MSIADTEKEIIEEFELFDDDWEAKYEHLIDLGRSMPMISEEHKKDEALIQGCQSKVWLHSEKKDDRIFFTADSDAIITKGLVALMVRVLSGHKASEIIDAKLQFINKIGLKEHLSPTRANGLVSMINRMKMDAVKLS